ncbi:MAG TPA: YaiI/YqxD family protein [Parachlamydiaceae bacterium]|nr:YaiI/YqxD family protein [Parachlamydiaceae bacterium]
MFADCNFLEYPRGKMPRHKPNKIWIDADACPKAVKEIVYKVSERLKLKIVLVANSYIYIPSSELIQLIVVDKGFDAADQHIIDMVEIHDIVITADIPLAAQVLKKKAIALNPRGEIYNHNTIGSILSMRDIMKEFYEAGTIAGGTAPFGPKDIKLFADSLNKLTS